MSRRKAPGGPVEEIVLPRPDTEGRVPLETAIAERRSVREFTGDALDDAAIAQLLWAAQGVSDPERLRTAPSAGALYPLELYVVTARGCARYDPARHRLIPHLGRDLRPALCRAALEQTFLRQAPAVFVFAAVARRVARKYGVEAGRRYTDMEVGHAAQNLLLQAVTLGLGGVPVGAFHEDRVRELMELPEGEEPLYIVPVGRPLDDIALKRSGWSGRDVTADGPAAPACRGVTPASD